MAEDSSTKKANQNLVAEIVSSYVGKNSIAVDEIGALIVTVHRALSGLGTNAPASLATEEKLTPAVPIRRSVQTDYVVCLECGVRGKTLRRHLRTTHGLEPAAYRARWKRGRLCTDRTRLFGATLGDGQTGRARPKAGTS